MESSSSSAPSIPPLPSPSPGRDGSDVSAVTSLSHDDLVLLVIGLSKRVTSLEKCVQKLMKQRNGRRSSPSPQEDCHDAGLDVFARHVGESADVANERNVKNRRTVQEDGDEGGEEVEHVDSMTMMSDDGQLHVIPLKDMSRFRSRESHTSSSSLMPPPPSSSSPLLPPSLSAFALETMIDITESDTDVPMDSGVIDIDENEDVEFEEEKEEEEPPVALLQDGVAIPPSIVKKLYPHQIEGIQFLWKNLILEEGGCILADYMGLGKTIQVVAFLRTLIVHRISENDGSESTPESAYSSNMEFKRAIVVCPSVVIKQWVREIEKVNSWMCSSSNVVKCELKALTLEKHRNLDSRISLLQQWHRDPAAVLIMSYDMFRTLFSLLEGSPDAKNMLLSPDIAILDEGHKIKHMDVKITQLMQDFKTKRRIILTGYPLQNNLMEYYTMIHFVNPDMLPDIYEFKKTYLKTIERGQCVDSSEMDRRIARRRAWRLHDRVSPLILRRGVSTLKKFLPKRHEVVISVKLTDVQRQMYRLFTELVEKWSLFWMYDCMTMLLNHPDILREYLRKKDLELEKEEQRLARKSIEEERDDPDYVGPTNETTETETNPHVGSPMATRNNKKQADYNESNQSAEEDGIESEAEVIVWRRKELQALKALFETAKTGYRENAKDASNKMLILFHIIKECRKIGDGLVVFSRSLNTLDYVQTVLDRHNSYPASSNINYVRFDGSTRLDLRQGLIDRFNDRRNNLNVFLISTLAGGEGINLHGANRVVLLDTNWNPSNDSEACCRVYRINQMKEVYVYRINTHETIEEKVHAKQLKKEMLSGWVIDNKSSVIVSNLQDRSLLKPPDEVPSWGNKTSSSSSSSPSSSKSNKDEQRSTSSQSSASDNVTENEDLIPSISKSVTDKVALSIYKKSPQILISIKDQQYLIMDDPSSDLSEVDKIIAAGEEEYDSVYRSKGTRRGVTSRRSLASSSSRSKRLRKMPRRTEKETQNENEGIHDISSEEEIEVEEYEYEENDTDSNGNDSALLEFISEPSGQRIRHLTATSDNDSASDINTCSNDKEDDAFNLVNGSNHHHALSSIHRLITLNDNDSGVQPKQSPKAPNSHGTGQTKESSLLAKEKEKMKRLLSQKLASKKSEAINDAKRDDERRFRPPVLPTPNRPSRDFSYHGHYNRDSYHPYYRTQRMTSAHQYHYPERPRRYSPGSYDDRRYPRNRGYPRGSDRSDRGDHSDRSERSDCGGSENNTNTNGTKRPGNYGHFPNRVWKRPRN